MMALRTARTLRHQRRQDIARAIHCSPSMISALERGDRPLRLSWLRLIADALDVNPGSLIRGEVR